MKPLLVLIYGPNGAGKTTITRALATKYRGLHVQIDIFSSMARGKFWYTRRNNKDKMALVLGILDAAIKNTKYRQFFVDGVLIYRFMFKQLEAWCGKNSVRFIPIYLSGNFLELDYRIKQRKTMKKNWNEVLPEFYDNFRYEKAVKVDTSGKKPEVVINEISSKL